MNDRPDCHPLFNPQLTPGGGLSLFLPDWMHTKSLGTDADLLGSVLSYWAKEVLPGNPEDNISYIWERVQMFYRENQSRCRLSRLTYNMVKHVPFPRLSAKAVETRDLLPGVEQFCREWVANNPGYPVCVHLHRLVLLSTHLDRIVFANQGLMLSRDECEEFKAGIFAYNQTLTNLAHHFHQRGQAYCNYTLKNHYLCHWGLMAARTSLSPRIAFCYQGEDFMGVVKTLTVASSRGIETAKLFDKVLEKYLRGLDFLLKQEV